MEGKGNAGKNLMANTADLAALVNYQSGSVVSRTIMERNTGTVTLFAFDQGQGLSEHTAPYDALVIVIDGEAIITVDGQSYNVKSGEATIMPANRPHALKANTKFKMMLVMIRGSE